MDGILRDNVDEFMENIENKLNNNNSDDESININSDKISNISNISNNDSKIVLKGLKGDKGIKGDNGEQGIPGNEGIPGYVGDRGLKGEKGKTGISMLGPTGNKGSKGEIGPVGNQGPIGLGIKGKKGDKGDNNNLIINSNIEGGLLYLEKKNIAISNKLLFSNNQLNLTNNNNNISLSGNNIIFSNNSLLNPVINLNIENLLNKYSCDVKFNRYISTLDSFIFYSDSIIINKSKSIEEIVDIDSKIQSYLDIPVKYFYAKKINFENAYLGNTYINNIVNKKNELISDSYKLNSKNKVILEIFGNLSDNKLPIKNINTSEGFIKVNIKNFMNLNYTKKHPINRYLLNRNNIEFINKNSKLRGSRRYLMLSMLNKSLSKNYSNQYPFSKSYKDNNEQDFPINDNLLNHYKNIFKKGNIIRTALNFKYGFTNNQNSGWRREVDCNKYDYILPNYLTNETKINIINNNIKTRWDINNYKTKYFIPPGDPGCYKRNIYNPAYTSNKLYPQDNNDSYDYGENQMPWAIINGLTDIIKITNKDNLNEPFIKSLMNNARIEFNSNNSYFNGINTYLEQSGFDIRWDKELILLVVEIETLNHCREFEYHCPKINFENTSNRIDPIHLYGKKQEDVKSILVKNINSVSFNINLRHYLDVIDYRSLPNVLDKDKNLIEEELWNYLESPNYDWDENPRKKDLILDTFELMGHPTIITSKLKNDNFMKTSIEINKKNDNSIYLNKTKLVEYHTHNTINNVTNIKQYINKDEVYRNVDDSTLNILSIPKLPGLLEIGNKTNNEYNFKVDSNSDLSIGKNPYELLIKTDIINSKLNLGYNVLNENHILELTDKDIFINGCIKNKNHKIEINSNLIPYTKCNLGSEQHMWENLYVKKLHCNNNDHKYNEIVNKINSLEAKYNYLNNYVNNINNSIDNKFQSINDTIDNKFQSINDTIDNKFQSTNEIINQILFLINLDDSDLSGPQEGPQGMLE